MADHIYKLHEVPKGERWQYFRDYYLVKTIGLVLVIIALVLALKATLFSSKPDVSILIAYTSPVKADVWEKASAGFQAMPLDLNKDGNVLIDASPIHIDYNIENTDPEMFAATQNKLMVSLAVAESALQIVDEELFVSLTNMELIGTYAELPDAMGHTPEDIVKIPLQELAPFNAVENLPEGLFMTLRPKDAMQIGNSEKKLRNYEMQLKALMTMMEK